MPAEARKQSKVSCVGKGAKALRHHKLTCKISLFYPVVLPGLDEGCFIHQRPWRDPRPSHTLHFQSAHRWQCSPPDLLRTWACLITCDAATCSSFRGDCYGSTSLCFCSPMLSFPHWPQYGSQNYCQNLRLCHFSVQRFPVGNSLRVKTIAFWTQHNLPPSKAHGLHFLLLFPWSPSRGNSGNSWLTFPRPSSLCSDVTFSAHSLPVTCTLQSPLPGCAFPAPDMVHILLIMFNGYHLSTNLLIPRM